MIFSPLCCHRRFKEDVILKLRKYDRAVIDELQTDEMMSAARYLKLWHALSTALRHMHALGVAHRDVKPDNILVTGDTFVLCDFHISQQTDVPAVPCGTEAYAAPELFVFGASNDPVPTDIWSAGVTLLACACGRLLWLRASKTDKRFECFTKRSTDDYVNEMLNTFQSAHFNATTRHLRCMIVHSLHLRPDCRPTSAAMAMVCS